jgi:group II intron reverse transcriptase/maturase
MRRAFRRVRKNRGVPGIDGVTVEMFEANLDQNLDSLMHDLKHAAFYLPEPVRRVYIPKGNGKLRPLGIPTVRDRVAQEVVRRLLEPIFEPTFADSSYGFRPGRNAHQAVEAVIDGLESGLRTVVDCDIDACYDNFQREVVIDLVAERVADGNILALIRKFLTAGYVEDGTVLPTSKGTPQGGVISPLLANIVLNVLDQQLILLGFRIVRYADDFVVLCASRAAAEQALTYVRQILASLGLSLSVEKTRIATRNRAGGFDFLGYRLSGNAITIRPKSEKKLKDRIRELTTRSHNFDQEVITKVGRVITGFALYFATPFSTVKARFLKLDGWIRRRLRSMKYKHISRNDNWRFPSRRLQALGLPTLGSFIAA